MMSRASLVRYSCPERVKPIFPMTHRPCLISSWVMSTVSEIQWATGSGPGPAKSAPRIVRGRPPAISIALRQSQMDIFDFISLSSPWQKPRQRAACPLVASSGAWAGLRKSLPSASHRKMRRRSGGWWLHGALVHESELARNEPDSQVHHLPRAYDDGLPSSAIRLRM